MKSVYKNINRSKLRYYLTSIQVAPAFHEALIKSVVIL